MKKTVKWILWTIIIFILLLYLVLFNKAIDVVSMEIMPKTVSKSINEKGKVIATDEKTILVL